MTALILRRFLLFAIVLLYIITRGEGRKYLVKVDDEESHGGREEEEEDVPLHVGCFSVAALLENVPGEEVYKQTEEPEVSVEISPDPLPLVPEEAGDDGMFEKMPVVFAATHVPQWLRLGQGQTGPGLGPGHGRFQ